MSWIFTKTKNQPLTLNTSSTQITSTHFWGTQSTTRIILEKFILFWQEMYLELSMLRFLLLYHSPWWAWSRYWQAWADLDTGDVRERCGHPAPDEPGYMMQIWTCWTQLSENMNKAIRESGPVCWCHQSYMISSVSKMCPALCSCSTVRFWSSEIINMFWRGFFLKKTTVAKLCDQIDVFKWGYLD